jgi:glucokinase
MNFGGVDNPVGKKFLTAIVHEIQTRALPVLSGNLSLHFASLGGDAGFIGAAGIARLAHEQHEHQ